MRKFNSLRLLNIFLAASIVTVCAGSALATVGFKTVSQSYTSEVTDMQFDAGTNWSYNGSILTVYGVNWQNISGSNLNQVNWTNANIGPSGINWQQIKGANLSQVNWVGSNILANSGVNWQALRVANGNTSSSINWQAFGV